ncbi:MAG: hypothetical protein B1H11_08295 [Desulfobacteraceae bacterium 4484_190.1]|nr:MAG: hypothetical protein B1H11_08295 [Desulfobacteraceae bacterium 4484_190.1]RLB18440.1 MAG: aminopeptidase P family protein [Deltaproteobacteria bacterium]
MFALPRKQEFLGRMKRFQRRLEKEDIDVAILVQKVDLYYLSGVDRDAQLCVPAVAPAAVIVQKELEHVRSCSAIENIVELTTLSSLHDAVLEQLGQEPRKLGLELDILPINRYQVYQKVFSDADIVDVSPLIREIRMVKSAYEIARIQKAAEMADSMFAQVPLYLQEAETEMELATRVEFYYRSKGHPGIIRTRSFNSEAFYGHLMSGKNAALPSSSLGPTGGKGAGPFYSQGASREKIGRHEPILIDYAANVEGYISDQTRIFSIGTLDEKYQKAHEIMVRLQDTLAETGKPGVRSGDLYDLAQKIIGKSRLKEGFMGYPDPVRFVGHGVGLELDEWPIIAARSDTILDEGMVLAIEPKVVFPGEGVVGIENTFVVTTQGMKKLNRFPDEICIC